MRHLAGFLQTFDEGLAAGQELIFVAGNLLGHMDGLHIGAIRTIHGDGLRIIDIVDDEITLGACDDTDIVAYTGGTRLQVAQHPVL